MGETLEREMAQALRDLLASFDAYSRDIRAARALGADIASEFPGADQIMAWAESTSVLRARRVLERFEVLR